MACAQPLHQFVTRDSRAKLTKGPYLAYFCNSGAEANEAALKLARKATGRTKILTFEGSFHGRTFGAMTATAQESIHQDFGPLVPDFEYLPFNEFSRCKQRWMRKQLR